METAAKQASGSKIEIIVNATGRQSFVSHPGRQRDRDKVSHLQDIIEQGSQKQCCVTEARLPLRMCGLPMPSEPSL